MLPEELRRLEVELPTAQQVDVERIDVAKQRLEPDPAPSGHAALESLGPALGADVAKLHPVVGVRHLDQGRVRRQAAQRAQELAAAYRHVGPDLHQRHDLPVLGERRVERAQRVGDASPLLDWRVSRVAAMDDVPDERADDAEPPALHTPPSCCCLKVATAPTTPAVPGSVAATMRQASTAGLKARRRTSARIGSKSASPACVTPPAMTTTSGLKMLSRLATPMPRNFAVSRTTSRAISSPRFAA